MPLNIIRNDISKVSADAIVNTANPQVAIGAGVDSTIYEAAGADKLLAERAKIGPMEPGQAAATPAFDLDAKYIIHTVGPAWQGGGHGEYEDVANCYRNSLNLADELGCESIAFPLISTGTLGFPKDEALRIATGEISSFLLTHDMMVYMVVFDKESFVLSGKEFSDIRTYIEETEVRERLEMLRRGGTTRNIYRPDGITYSARRSYRRKGHTHGKAKDNFSEEEVLLNANSVAGYIDLEEDAILESTVHSLEDMEPTAEELDQIEAEAETDALLSIDYLEDFHGEAEKGIGKMLEGRGDTFQKMLFRHIDRKGLKDPEVYKRANIDRKLFSKIRSDANYQPSKRTVLALSVALKLNIDETLDLLQRAGYSLSPASNADLIVGYCITHKIYDIFKINNYLFKYNEPLLAG